jgi:plastocyanin
MKRFYLVIIFCAFLVPPLVAGDSIKITIADLAFSPADVTVKLGDTIEWVNRDFVDHTATDRGGAWDVAIAVGRSSKVTLTKPGTFAYFCKMHPNMTGTIHVQAN